MPGAYADAVGAQIEVVTPLLSGFFDKTKTLYAKFQKVPVKSQSGRDMRMPIELRPGGKTRQVSLDGATIGTGGGPVFDYTAMSPIDKMHVISWTMKAKFTTDEGSKAVVDYAQRTIASAITEASIREDKHLQTAGQGVLAVVSGYAAGPPKRITCAVTAAAPFGVRLLRYGDEVTCWATGLGAGDIQCAALQIVAIDYINNTFDVTGDTSTPPAATSKILVGGMPAGAVPVSTYGLPYGHNRAQTGYFLGKDRASYQEFWTPWVDGNSGYFSTELFQRMLLELDNGLGEDVTETGDWGLYMNPKQHFPLVTYMTQISEISLNPGGSGNGQVDLAFGRKKQRVLNGYPIYTSINADPTRVDFIDFKNWLRGTYKELGWYKFGNQVIAPIPNSTSYDTAEMSALVWSTQYACRNPRRGVYTTGLSIPS